MNIMFNFKISGKSSLSTKEPALQWDSAAVELCRRRTRPWGCAPEGCQARRKPAGQVRHKEDRTGVQKFKTRFSECFHTSIVFPVALLHIHSLNCYQIKVSSLSYSAKQAENTPPPFPLQIPHLISAMFCMLMTLCFPERKGRWCQTR